MKIFREHLSRILKSSTGLLFIVLFIGCDDAPKEVSYVARVDDALLTEKMLEEIYGVTEGHPHRSEAIRSWINTELLYLEATQKDIVNSDEYIRLVSNAKRDIAKALLIQHFFDEQNISVSEFEVKKYYEEQKNGFSLSSDAFVINKVIFNDAEKAIAFRKMLNDSYWELAVSVMEKDSSLVDSKLEYFVYDRMLYPASLVTVCRELRVDEISYVLKLKNNHYAIIQLLEQYSRGDIPPLEIVYDQVMKTLLHLKKQEAFNEYLQELYSNKDIEIKD